MSDEELKNKMFNFKASIADFSLEQLKEKQKEINDAITKMVLDSDLVLQAAVVESLIKEKESHQA